MEKYDVVIVGNGAAALSAAIYSRRAGFSTLLLSNNPISGGQILSTYEVDNYMGFPNMLGSELADKFYNHAKNLGAEFKTETVKKLYKENENHIVKTRKNEYIVKAALICTGASHRKLNIEGESDFLGMGVSYCATCDGAFYKDKKVMVVGGGNTALEDAIYLSNIAKKVYLVHRRDAFRADKIVIDSVLKNKNIEIIYDTVVEKIVGESFVKEVVTFNKKTNEKKSIEIDGLFVAVGIIPNTDKIEGLPMLSNDGYIVASEDGKTSIPWIYAAGDVRTKSLRQIITAASDGANAVDSIKKYLNT